MKAKKISLSSQTVPLLILIAAIAFTLRFYLIPQHLFFGPEQGIDFTVIRDIATGHKLTLIGSKTDIPGVFHGPLYYYISAVPFAITGGNPIAVIFTLILIQALTIFPIYGLGKELWNRQVGFIAAILFTVSYSAIVNSRWLSSPPLALPLVCLFFYSFTRYLKGSNRYLLLSALSFGLLVQSQFLNLILFSVILLFLIIIFCRRILATPLRILLPAFLILGLTSIGNFVLFDLKHQFLISNSLLELLSGKRGYYLPPNVILSSMYEKSVDFYGWILTPTFSAITPLIFIVLAVLLLKKITHPIKNSSQTIVAVWLFTPFLIFFLLHHDLISHYFIPFLPAFILGIAYGLDLLFTRNKILGFALFLALILFNLFIYVKNIPSNSNIFFQANQPHFYYSDQQKIIAETYKKAGNRPFSIQAFTIPYWKQEGWLYLFWYEGTQKHLKLPVKDDPDKLFVIVQDNPSDRLFQWNWLQDTVSTWGKEVGRFYFGDISVIIRQVK